jgi:5'-deoxynucleotidase YfbR-like HD superfamily hydrolase
MRLLFTWLGYRVLALYDLIVRALLRCFFGAPYVGTRSGGHVPLIDPLPRHIKTRDIAHALSHQCRYGGHVRHHYSVAQHSYHVSRGTMFRLEGALHDAAEAYLGDVCQPLKNLVRPIYGVLERNFERIIGERYHMCPQPFHASLGDLRRAQIVWRAVKKADEDTYLWEASHLIQACLPPDWKGRTYQRPPVAWMPHAAKAYFLEQLESLGIR